MPTKYMECNWCKCYMILTIQISTKINLLHCISDLRNVRGFGIAKAIREKEKNEFSYQRTNLCYQSSNQYFIVIRVVPLV